MSLQLGADALNGVVIADTFEETTFRRVAWRLMPIFFLCYFVAYLDRINVSFAKLQMLSDLKLSEAAYGVGAGIFFIGYCIFEVPSNMILHKVGARRWIARIMLTWGVLSIAMAWVEGEKSFYVLRFLLGVAEAGLYPGVLVYLSQWFPASRRGRITALFMAGNPLSGIIGGPLSGLIMVSFGGALHLATCAYLAGNQWAQAAAASSFDCLTFLVRPSPIGPSRAKARRSEIFVAACLTGSAARCAYLAVV